MDSHAPERRRSERLPFREDILIDGTRTSTTMDISEGGLYICAINCYEEDSFIRVSIPLGGEKLTLRMQVRYCQPGIGMGVKFVDLSEAQRARLGQAIARISGKPACPLDIRNKVLLVEDSSATRQAIKNALSMEGLITIEAADGIEVVRLIEERRPDLIILDLYMKGMDGLKVLTLLKTNQKWKEIPVIVCSGHDTEELRSKVIDAGAEQFLPKKGTSATRLVQSVKELLKNRGHS